MSDPPPDTVQTPFASDAEPSWEGKPMSSSVQPGGTCAIREKALQLIEDSNKSEEAVPNWAGTECPWIGLDFYLLNVNRAT